MAFVPDRAVSEAPEFMSIFINRSPGGPFYSKSDNTDQNPQKLMTCSASVQEDNCFLEKIIFEPSFHVGSNNMD